MPAKKEYAAEFKEQSVRFVLEHIEAEESRYSAGPASDHRRMSSGNRHRQS